MILKYEDCALRIKNISERNIRDGREIRTSFKKQKKLLNAKLSIGDSQVRKCAKETVFIL